MVQEGSQGNWFCLNRWEQDAKPAMKEGRSSAGLQTPMGLEQSH